MSREGKAICGDHVIIQGGHVTDLRCRINRCPHTFFYKCIIYNSAVLQQRVVAMWCLTLMKMDGRFFFFRFTTFKLSCAGLPPQSLQAFAYLCFYLMVWDSLVNISYDKQFILAQSPDYVFFFFFLYTSNASAFNNTLFLPGRNCMGDSEHLIKPQ